MITDFDKTTQDILIELEKTQRDFWNISRPTALFLFNLIKNEGLKCGLEVGTSNGYSGIWLSTALKANGGTLDTIEFMKNVILLQEQTLKNAVRLIL